MAVRVRHKISDHSLSENLHSHSVSQRLVPERACVEEGVNIRKETSVIVTRKEPSFKGGKRSSCTRAY